MNEQKIKHLKPKKENVRSFFIAAAVAFGMSALLWSLEYYIEYEYTLISEFAIKNISYEYPNSTIVYDRENYNINLATNEDISISFKFMIDSYQRKYQNIFQTANGNNGVRVEIGQDGYAGIVIGDGNGEIIGVSFKSQLDLNKWYDFDMKIDKNGVGAVNISSSGKKLKTFINIGEKMYKISDVKIGTGFNETRDFVGKVKDFNLVSKYYKVSPVEKNIIKNFIILKEIFMWIGILCLMIKWASPSLD